MAKKSYGRTKAGVELIDEALDRMPREAEEGLDVGNCAGHPAKRGTVTIAGKPSDDVRAGTLASIFRQAGLGGSRVA